MTRKLTLLCTAAALLLATPALAQDEQKAMDRPHHEKGEMFEKADSDNDGRISEEEFVAKAVAKAKEHFAKMDADSDGFITKEEGAAAREQWKEKMGERREEMKEHMKDRMKEHRGGDHMDDHMDGEDAE